MSDISTKTAALQGYEKISGLPAGKLIFSKLISRKAPYFRSIDPRIIELRPNYMSASLRKRKAVTNHIGTVHAIAMCNLCEYIGGTLMEVSRPRTTRWIPRGMQVQYLAKAETDLRGVCELGPVNWNEKGSVICHVEVLDTAGQKVMQADIDMYISPVQPG